MKSYTHTAYIWEDRHKHPAFLILMQYELLDPEVDREDQHMEPNVEE